MLLWFYLALGSAMTIAVVNLLDKYILSNLVKRPEIPLFYVLLLNLIVIFLLPLFISLPLISFAEMFIGIIAGIFFSMMVYFFFKASFLEEISRTVPFFYLSPLFVAIISFFFLDEILQIGEYLGMVLVVTGAFFITRKEKTSLSIGKASFFMLASAFSFSLYNVLVDYLSLTYNFWTVFAYTRIGIVIGFVPILYIYRKELIAFFQESNITKLSVPFANEILAISGMLLTVMAIAYGPVTLVSTILATRPIFVLILSQIIAIFSTRLLKEEFEKHTFLKKSFSILLMFLGTVLILLN